MNKLKIAVLTSGWSVDYVLSVLEGMKKICKENNTDLYVFTSYKFNEPTGNSNTTSFAIFDLINYKDYDGIVIMPNLFNDQNLVEKYAAKILESGVPAVTLNQPLEGFHFVNSENHEIYKKFITHLIKDHQATTFAYIDGPTDNPGVQSNYLAFKEALQEANLDIKKSQIFYDNCDWTFNNAYEVAKKILKNKTKRPDAIVCINDLAAMAATKVVLENGYSVPKDIKIIGFDDIEISTKVTPSISSISMNAKKMGETAIRILLKKQKTLQTREIKSSICLRQSCGCHQELTSEQIIYSQSFVKELDREQRFSSQLRYLEDSFIKYNSIPKLSQELQQYYEKRHTFEGEDFAICIDKKVINNITNKLTEENSISTYSDKMQTIVNLQNGIPVEQYQIDTKELIPPNMKSDKSTLYFFLPIFNQKKIHGYYVSKNFTDLLINKRAYNWMRNFGTMIEKFRQTSIYRSMSEELRIISNHDSLTGLFNREGLKNYGEKLFIENNTNQIQTQVIFVDINNMKIINDKFGHLQGDLAIKTVAEAIASCTPTGYIAIRYGGDEFVIIGTPKSETNFYLKISDVLAQKVKQMTLPYTLTVSLGSKVFSPNEKSTLKEAINDVDEIMYLVKQKYHNQNA